jgi:hypothetical protein
MAAEDTTPEEVIDDVDPVEVQEDEQPAPEDTATPEEEQEPDEADYADPAEYRKALREFSKAQGAKETQKEYARRLEGVQHDLLKQRRAKREMRMQMEQMAEYIQQIVQVQSKPQAPEKPDPMKYTDAEAYGKDYAKWISAQEQQVAPEAQPRTQQVDPDQQAWQGRIGAAIQTDPAMQQAVAEIQRTGVGQHIRPEATRVISQSPIGTEVFKYLAFNPELTEEIEDLPTAKQVQAIRIIESQILTGRLQQSSQRQPAAPAAAPQPKPVAKPVAPKIPNPPSVNSGAPAIGPKKLTEAKSMAEYMRLRNKNR